MAEIRPFRGIRYDTNRVGGLQEVIGPPEDIPSNEQAVRLIEGHPYHSVRLELIDPVAPLNFSRSNACMRRWLDLGILQQDLHCSVYAHEHEYEFGGERRRHRGFFVSLRLTSYAEGQVLPHENTLPSNVALRFALLHDVKANLSAVYTLMQDEGQLRELFAEVMSSAPDESGFDPDGGVHRIWVVSDQALIDRLQALAEHRRLYIADGHHRYTAALAYRDHRLAAGADVGEADWVLAYIADVADPGILVLPIHRVIRSLGSFSWPALLNKLADWFEIERVASGANVSRNLLQAELNRLPSAAERATYLALAPGARELLRLRLRSLDDIEAHLPPSAGPVTRNMDVTVLDAVLLRHLLTLSDAEMETVVDFTPDVPAAFDAVRAGESEIAVFVRPTPLQSLLTVAEAGERMPQKSSYFFPKIPIGLVAHDLETDDSRRPCGVAGGQIGR